LDALKDVSEEKADTKELSEPVAVEITEVEPAEVALKVTDDFDDEAKKTAVALEDMGAE
jgi:predicted metalloenzyme YecM